MKYIIIGYGNIGKKRSKVLNKKCIATVDPFQEKATYSNYKEVPIDIFDAAIVAVPNAIKIEILKYLLLHKKHVLIEKPLLFKDKKFAHKLYSIAKANDVIWYTSYNHRFEPMVIKLKEFLEKQIIGQFYFVKFIYGNGTAQNIAGTWRDTDYGVLEDLGCHLIDIAAYLFPTYNHEYKITGAHNFETNALDYCSFSTVDGHLQFLCSTLMWKNTFRIEVFGNKGSIHLNGLHKWGKSQLIYYERIFPSGVPKETIFTSSGVDESWKKDMDFFEEMVSLRKSSYENDLYILQSINSLISNYLISNKKNPNR